MMRNGKSQSGFTLIELLVVVAIIALLISILLPSLSQAKEQAKVAACVANNRSLLQATTLYFNDYNDAFPFEVKSASGGSGICSWSYGGKTNDDHWIGKEYFYHEVQNRPMNPYIMGTDPEPDLRGSSNEIIKKTEVSVLRCPSDKHTWQRDLDAGTTDGLGFGMPAYDDVGTSYHFNLACYLRGISSSDVRKSGMSSSQMSTWLWSRGGWTTMVRDNIREQLTKHASTYAMYWEDPMDYGISSVPTISTMGNHKKFARHTIAFLDGHSKNQIADTRVYCGVGWHALNPEWIDYSMLDDRPRPTNYYYNNITYRNCDPYQE